MSLPREILDELLSGYLDGALSADERSRVERLLETDVEVRRELEELRNLRQAIRAEGRVNTAVKLPEGFPSRVLDAAIACAQSEGLSEDHPLMRCAEQPSARPAMPASATPWYVAGAAVALAASIAFAVFVWAPSPSPEPGEAGVARVEPGNPEPGNPERAIESVGGGDRTDLAQVQPKSADSKPPTPGTENDAPETAVAARPPASDVDSAINPGPEPLSPTVEAIAADTNRTPNSAQPKAGADMADLVGIDGDAGPGDLGEVLLLDIRLTPAGRESDAVQAAMRKLGFGQQDQRAVDEEIVSAVRGAADGKVEAASILYIQAPMTQLADLIDALDADREGIESVGLGLAFDAPIANLMTALQQVDPKTVRQTSSWQLTGRGADALASYLSEQSYMRYSEERDSGNAIVGARSAKVNADHPEPILMLVR